MRDIKIYNSFINKPFRNKTYNGSNILKGTAGEDFFGEDASHLSLKTDNLNSDNLNLLIESSENFRSENNNMICLFDPD